jgi:hypothetical protein
MDKAKLIRIGLRVAAAVIGALIAEDVLSPELWGAIATGLGALSLPAPGSELKS